MRTPVRPRSWRRRDPRRPAIRPATSTRLSLSARSSRRSGVRSRSLHTSSLNVTATKGQWSGALRSSDLADNSLQRGDAMSEPTGIPSLRSYLESLEGAGFSEHAAREGSRVANEDAFGEMRSHVSQLYEGVEALHSFVDVDGGVIDCIPIEQQPALRGSSESIPTAPDLPPLEVAPDVPADTTVPGGQPEDRIDS